MERMHSKGHDFLVKLELGEVEVEVDESDIAEENLEEATRDMDVIFNNLPSSGVTDQNDAAVSAAPSDLSPPIIEQTEVFSQDEITSAEYTTLLTDFYKQHNAEKIGEVEKTLIKFKGNEVELFEKMSTKYKVENPLDVFEREKSKVKAEVVEPTQQAKVDNRDHGDKGKI